ncbi:MAG: thioredoxin domain-containing protein, partial [Acidobacteriota bacterium]|nr:thioredoxin domain-containing protein [Acidobacteriota bacterium]
MRAVTLLCCFALAVSAAPPVKRPVVSQTPAFNKSVFESYVRHLFVWPTAIQVEVGDPKPGPIPGFDEVRVRASQGKASQEEVFYVSKDGRKIIRGQVFDIAQNPFKSDLDKIKTELRPSMGTPGAPVVLVEFSDFECHFCRDEAKTLRENLLKDYPKEVRLYFMDFPLESVHPWARAAADAGQCIFKMNPAAFWDYHDWIFEQQEQIAAGNLEAKVLEFARTKELDGDKLKACMNSKTFDASVEQSLAQGRALGVQSTPTLFVNGRKLVGAVDWRE